MPQIKKSKLFIMLAVAVFTAAVFACAPAAHCQQGTGMYSIAAGTSKIINISEPIKRVSVGNPGVAEYTVLSKNEIIMLGVKVGRTELHIWTENDFKTFIIRVFDDVVEMKAKLTEIMGPHIAKSVSVHVAKETAVLKGMVSSVYESEQVEKIATLYYPRILNLLEIRGGYASASVSAKKSRAGATYEMGAEAGIVPAQGVEAEQAAAAQYPQAGVGNLKDILELRAARSYKGSPDAYGTGASPEFAAVGPVSSATIPQALYENANDKTTRIITLQNAMAADVEAALNRVKSPEGLVIKDDRTNSLVLIDKPSSIEKLEKVIKIFDAPTPQVLIEAKIIEVSLNDDMKNTLNWIYDTLYSGTNPLGTALNNKSVKINDGSMDFALDYGKISSDHFAMKVLPSLQKRHARLVASPSTVTLDKKEATFGVTDNIPYLKYTPQGTTGNLLPTPEYVSPAPGVTLKVTPNINQDGVIRMNINVQIGSFVENVNFGQYGTVPRTSSRQSSNFVEVNNGETLIISGLMSNISSQSANKVPWFSKLPLIGNLFESKLKGDSRTELVIFITPKIVGKDSRFAQLDKDRYPKIVENKMPDVGEKFDMKKFLGMKEEKEEKEEKVLTASSSAKAPGVEKAAAPVEPVKALPEAQISGPVVEYKFNAGPDLDKTKKILKAENRFLNEVKTSAAEKIDNQKSQPVKFEAVSAEPVPSPAVCVQAAAREDVKPAPAPVITVEKQNNISMFRSERAYSLVEKLRRNVNNRKTKFNR
ncbi:MAG: hypothetical protein A2008_01670 [Candidatus Wallbacteria bacterium GWC2_49_35]|uniref:NolW-like domain-containing protein n=1 Tax=Candidatus Wallbacteria bacterium GWC2_49_35 TaxID=1817813 RepID=A0A1F7WSV5_9BACT|nr:MAG: hypothetical protein A2008_01670 [Candidatus Wallbacteria bacterium GWC2_49_35]